MKGYGWNDKLLRVDLTDQSFDYEKINPDYAREYIGGRGISTRMLLDEGIAKVDPLSSENKLFLLTGPMTGSAAPTTGRWMATTKSPLNGLIDSANAGGTWGAKLKHAGLDGIILEGKSDEKIYMYIEDTEVSFHSADDLWGKDVEQVDDILVERHPGSVVLAIGEAGENLSNVAAIINDRSRAAGRGGTGAVMGSKNLKAIVVKATENRFEKIENADALKEANSRAIKILREHGVTGEGLRAYGTAVLVNIINEVGALPKDNWIYSYDENADNYSGETMTDTILTGVYGCYRCPIVCGRRAELDGQEIAGPEYETVWAYGGSCRVDDLEVIRDANNLCDKHGLDSISVPVTIATGMEMYQDGIIPEEDCEGVPLEFGSAEAVIEWTKRIAKSETELGKIMALGADALEKHYGVEGKYAMTSKGLEAPAYDARAIQGIGLNYATSNRGACHVQGYTIAAEVLGDVDRTTTEGKGQLVKDFQDLTAVIDSMGMCLFTSFAMGAQEYRDLLEAATGIDLTVEELMETGERIYNVERLFNKEAGMDPKSDSLPERMTDSPIKDGPSKGMVSQMDVMLPDYYKVRGWEDAFPTEETLERLNLA